MVLSYPSSPAINTIEYESDNGGNKENEETLCRVTMTSTQRFTIMLRFQTSAFVDEIEGGMDIPALQTFLYDLPTLLQPLCRRDIQYTIVNIAQDAEKPLLLQLVLEVIPNWFQGYSTVEDDDFRRLGIKEPERTRGSIAVNLWLLSLQRYGEGPLQTAWKLWQKEHQTDATSPTQTQSPCPLMLVQYSIS